MNHDDAKKCVRPFMRMFSICIALIAAVMIFGCNQNVGNESKTPVVQYKVTLEKTAGGNVTVTPAMPDSGMVDKNTELTFTATAASGYEVETWTVSPNTALKTGGTAGSLSATVTITTDTTVKVTFKHSETLPPKHTVTFDVDGGNGRLSATLDGTAFTGNKVEQGKTVEFTASPFFEYTVDRWSIDGDVFEEGTGAAGSRTARVKITADITVKVKFKPTITDQEKVEKAAESLKLYFPNGDTADSITSNQLNLPLHGLHRTQISWESSNEAIIKVQEGSITRPEEDTPVTLTATITSGAVCAPKSFPVTVRGTNQEAVSRAAERVIKQISPVVTKDMSSITLPIKETVSIEKSANSFIEVEVDIEWKAEPTDIIAVPACTVKPHETETKTVTLTATAKTGRVQATKTVTVTVYPKNNEPNIQDVLNDIVNTLPTAIDTDISLPQSPAGYKLTWVSPNDSILKISENSGHIETWDLVYRTLELTATLKKNGGSKTAEQKKTVTINARKRFTIGNDGGTYEFEGDKLTLRHSNGEPAAVYHVNIDGNAKTITATLERLSYQNNNLITPEEVAKLVFAEKETMPNMWLPILELQQKDLVTLKDIQAIHRQFVPESITNKDIFEVFVKLPLSSDMSYKDMSYEEFLKKAPKEQSELIKKALKLGQNSIYKELGLPENTPLTEFIAELKSSIKKDVDACLKRAKEAHTYQYRIERDKLTVSEKSSGKPIPFLWEKF
ncbi:hypothetical protein ABK01_09835 [Treponema sp. OMZ 305]|uniref:immunoglobulin-like domain-containing protein n=1 Tax=Treponema sp. OMZ 305 TaxID=1659192 RepID=UPI0020A31FA4|nr:immunoglobulin-like domain-containing protein [Treponema sp. OMZ 305]UTC58531.1 hypothetical protein ABK01_09835 [Treponema sp. OMZ 305]